jgi:hypothetical protein
VSAMSNQTEVNEYEKFKNEVSRARNIANSIVNIIISLTIAPLLFITMINAIRIGSGYSLDIAYSFINFMAVGGLTFQLYFILRMMFLADKVMKEHAEKILKDKKEKDGL